MQRAPRASFQHMHDQGAKKGTGAEDHGPDQKGIPWSGISGGSAIGAPTKTELGRRSPARLILKMDATSKNVAGVDLGQKHPCAGAVALEAR